MRRIFLLFSLFVLTFFLLSCQDGQPNKEIITETIHNEIAYLAMEIPFTISDDFILPKPLSDEVSYDFYFDGIKVEEVYSYEEPLSDMLISLEIIVSCYDMTDSVTFEISLLNQSNEDDSLEVQFDKAFQTIKHQLPQVMQSSVFLPSIDGINVTYQSSCSTIIRNRLQYTYPDTLSECSLVASVNIGQETRAQSFTIFMAAYEDLPQIPVVHITTSQEITSNVEYVSGTLSLDTYSNTLFPSIEEADILIRLRGNSTLSMPKKPYKIKFLEKTKFMSFYAEKDWVLLANYTDHTLLRNYLAYSLMDDISDSFTPTYHFVDVYVNGEYQGNYMVSDQIEVTNDRVAIHENETLVNTGYLLELDIGLYRVGLEESMENYFLVDGIPFVIKSPNYLDPHYRQEQKDYIESYINTVFDVLETQGDYSNLIDEDSFIDWLIVTELFKNVDSWYSSVYFYKDKDGLLEIGPVWDFDLSSGNPGHLESSLRGPEGFYTMRQDRNVLYYYLMQYDSFKEHFKDRWNELYEPVIKPLLNRIFATSDQMTYSVHENFERWDIIGSNYDWYTAPEIYDIKTYEEQVWFLYDYLDQRMEWLDSEINKF